MPPRHLRLRFQQRNGSSTLAARITGGVAMLLIAVLVWLSADPEAHERFHHDADHEDHHCVVTDFAMGEGYYVAPRIVVAPAGMVFEVVRFTVVEALREPVDYRLLPICGPPGRAVIG